jgi:predicted FMN-binding regulatory protein PaiB
MLYTPPAFKSDDLPTLHHHMDSAGLAMIVSMGERGPLISHAPLLLNRAAGPFGTLIGHLAKANPQTTLALSFRDRMPMYLRVGMPLSGSMAGWCRLGTIRWSTPVGS